MQMMVMMAMMIGPYLLAAFVGLKDGAFIES